MIDLSTVPLPDLEAEIARRKRVAWREHERREERAAELAARLRCDRCTRDIFCVLAGCPPGAIFVSPIAGPTFRGTEA